ncbi:uroporphyrinogen-III synthase [Salinibacillus xinjiangensis]|uniref:Uroporphyrinogen-III synthase n=1 Tax=Salinibacillus xinjiangensis TaxID=1229268 RepID=A0A6G1XBP1_9BACI|nr:uroporphyrinogen-III synthase [Salinibacillus xinjiangensis]MRG88208.1 uroporphyrinogen-III synthase [Salinibacillus xinjiangensis]
MNLPLKGMNIMVTREKKQAEPISNLIRQYGGVPIEIPLLIYDWIDQPSNRLAFEQLDEFDWLFFTSVNGVRYFIKSIEAYGLSLDHFHSVQIGAVGKKTSEKLKEYGFTVDFEPTIYTAEYMGDEFLRQHHPKKVLLVRGTLSRPTLPEFFTEQNIPFSSVTVYATRVNVDIKNELINELKSNTIHVLTFMSPSTIEAFFQLGKEEIDENTLGRLCICIGTTTRKKAEEMGFQRILIPENFTGVSMIHRLVDHMDNRKGIKHE